MEARSAKALTPMHGSGVIAERDYAVLRFASEEDLPAVDSLTVVCYRPIWKSYVAMLGEECYAAVRHRAPALSATWGCASRTSTPGSTTPTSRLGARMKRWASTAPSRQSSTGGISPSWTRRRSRGELPPFAFAEDVAQSGAESRQCRLCAGSTNAHARAAAPQAEAAEPTLAEVRPDPRKKLLAPLESPTHQGSHAMPSPSPSRR
jgi:hypothetical protein